MLQDFLKKLQQELELQEFVKGEVEDSVVFLLDDTRIHIIDSAPGFQLYALLGPLPAEKSEQFMTSMLRGNLFGQATRRAVLGLDDTGTIVTIRLFHPEKPTYKEFFEQIEDFINVVDFWQEELRTSAL